MILLTSPARVKRDTTLNSNVDDNLVAPAILVAQERHAHSSLGTSLYKKLQDLIRDNEVNDAGNEDYKELLDGYVVPMLVQFTFAHLIPQLRVRFVNNAVVTMNSEQSQAASYEDLKPIINSSNDIGHWYKERLVDYLCFNRGLFPEYSDNTGAEFQPETRNYSQGLNINTTTWKGSELKYLRGLLGL
jgi:hypothetical protein